MLVLYGLRILLKILTKSKWFREEPLDLYTTLYIVSVSNMISSLGWPTLQTRRNYLKLLLTYTILKAMISIPSDNFKPVTVNTRGYQFHFQCLQCTCDSYRFSFFPSSIRLWNCLPTDITSVNTFNEFTEKLKQHFIDNFIDN